MALNERLEFMRGDTIKFTVSCTRKDSAGVAQPADLTGAFITCTLKRERSDTDADAFAQVTTPFAIDRGINILNQLTNKGEAQVVFAAGETDDAPDSAEYFFDVQVEEADGTLSTPSAGIIAIKPDVTRAGVS